MYLHRGTTWRSLDNALLVKGRAQRLEKLSVNILRQCTSLCREADCARPMLTKKLAWQSVIESENLRIFANDITGKKIM